MTIITNTLKPEQLQEQKTVEVARKIDESATRTREVGRFQDVCLPSTSSGSPDAQGSRQCRTAQSLSEVMK
ncbi:hypothetical protein [Deinococcus sp. Leaf326]|uniref:hypothetical protein n=1 Tax=Deinococcus sp. Leaf326 TaxID=1736338 RepID=UPI0006F9D1B2|nr:hypothetical protein [Deinococcus sp. Leaf326]KQQ99823.1 hypothetical protein ASF71_21920 [Deinococcus sp. Leaf326]